MGRGKPKERESAEVLVPVPSVCLGHVAVLRRSSSALARSLRDGQVLMRRMANDLSTKDTEWAEAHRRNESRLKSWFPFLRCASALSAFFGDKSSSKPRHNTARVISFKHASGSS